MFLLCIIFLLKPSSIWSQEPPKKLPWNTWAERLMYGHLINMTAELVKDATYKLKHAEKIKDKHSHSITYELGFIAAGIQERFQRMLIIYRKMADLKTFQTDSYPVPELMNAYHVIQGDYNEIRLEKGIFHDIVRRHESTPSTSKYRIPEELMKQFQLMSTFSPQRRKLKWSPSDNYESFD